MSWTWRFLAPDGGTAPGVDDGTGRTDAGFPTQSDAESWLGEHWRGLVEDGREVYGPMSLAPPD